jgi:hypothetical protein
MELKSCVTVSLLLAVCAAKASAAIQANNPLDPNPKINQVGYLPASKKFFAVVADNAKNGNAYTIEDANGSAVFEGTVSGDAIDDRASTGEYANLFTRVSELIFLVSRSRDTAGVCNLEFCLWRIRRIP